MEEPIVAALARNILGLNAARLFNLDVPAPRATPTEVG
jgi:hypothetical protein